MTAADDSTGTTAYDSTDSTAYEVEGLSEPVEILVDRWGVPHLYAESEDDLFRAQGFNAARDRLFQIDLWRRRGLGLLSEVFGPECAEHDRAARLFLYRGGMEEEWEAYGPGTERVARAFTEGVNAYVRLCRERPELLPPEFGLLGYGPSLWNPSDVARIRSHGLQYNLQDEVDRALTLRDFGPELGPEVEELRKVRDPEGHRLRVPEGLDLSVIPDDVLDVYRKATVPPWAPGSAPRPGIDGSNNWVLAPSRTATGRPLLANDPHRPVTLPSLRYMAHLSAPGIDVIGAGEPALPGVSIGHNGRLAFGLTIFPIDQEDLYVYETNPDNPREYRYQDHWEPMTLVRETIPVLGGEDVEAELWFTRHGPVIRERPERHAAFAVRAAWLEPGMAPYLGSMDYMRAEDPDAFTAALSRWGAPGENQVYAAPDGTVGWRPAGRVPARDDWDGTFPVPGDGRYEWRGHHPVDLLPSVRDPAEGWFATANQHNLPADYPHAERPVTHDWYAPTRHQRISEALAAREDWTVRDCVRLQNDGVSLPARRILAVLRDAASGEGADSARRVRDALALLAGWDGVLDTGSAAGALFEVWYRRHLRPALLRRALRGLVPEERVEAALARVLPAADAPADPRVDLRLLPDAPASLLLDTLADADAELAGLLGPDRSRWSWGSLHHARLTHPVAALLPPGAVVPEWAGVGPAPRGGSGDTVSATAYAADFRQFAGASFRLVIDVGAWDESLAINSPGQSGDPRSPHYRDLFGTWAEDGAFPLLYSRDRVREAVASRIVLRPPYVWKGADRA
ncbi:penicillin acylase family protein [Streptomyces sp. ODS28]|uniref:penicillin acylase family protein n=1 Tax=Streptomyces sp. ODS28 TaxID=3136688 RepID=UPI0031ED7C95